MFNLSLYKWKSNVLGSIGVAYSEPYAFVTGHGVKVYGNLLRGIHENNKRTNLLDWCVPRAGLNVNK